MPNPSQRSGKQRLIDAAAQIVSTQGVQQLTLEGVAAAAGVTKGGLIYHFKTKDDLLAALARIFHAYPQLPTNVPYCAGCE